MNDSLYYIVDTLYYLRKFCIVPRVDNENSNFVIIIDTRAKNIVFHNLKFVGGACFNLIKVIII